MKRKIVVISIIIAIYRVMQNRINRIKANGTNAEIEVFNGLPHGFGIG